MQTTETSKFMEMQHVLHRHGLTLNQYVTIESCCEQRRMKEIAKDLGLTTAAITGLVDRIVEKGFVYRNRGTKAEDRRTVYVQTSKSGLAVVEEVQAIFD